MWFMEGTCTNQWKIVLLAKDEVLNLHKSSKMSDYKMSTSQFTISYSINPYIYWKKYFTDLIYFSSVSIGIQQLGDPRALSGNRD